VLEDFRVQNTTLAGEKTTEFCDQLRRGAGWPHGILLWPTSSSRSDEVEVVKTLSSNHEECTP